MREEVSISMPRPISNLDQDEIFKAATDYQLWSYKRYTLKDLPPFDSSTSFGITAEDENRNIREEIRKLVQFVTSNKPPLFDSYGTLGDTNLAGFDDLYNVVDQIICNLEIIRHGNASLALDHYINESFYNAFKDSRRNLRWRYLSKSSKMTGQIPKTLGGERKNAQAYHALVDFIFQSLAWWLMHVAERKSWRSPIIAILARWSVKLKIIALDPVRWAEMSLIRGEDVMSRISNDQKDDNRVAVEFPSFALEAERKKVYFPEDRDPDYYYYSMKFQMRSSLDRLVGRMLNNLISEKSDSTKSTAFEVRTLIYRGVLDKALRHLTVQQDGTIETSSDRTGLRRSYCALQLLMSNAQGIAERGTVTSSSELANFHWFIKFVKGSDPVVGSVATGRVDDIVSTLVPLSLIGSSNLVKSLKSPLWVDNPDDDYLPAIFDLALEDSLRIEFSLSTRELQAGSSRGGGPSMVPPSRSPLITSLEGNYEALIGFRFKQMPTVANEHPMRKDIENMSESDTGDIESPELDLKRNAIKILRDYEIKKAEIKSWTVTEDSVRVGTAKYSGAVLTIAFAIIGGSLVVPFVVKEDIPGVDPFQFVTFGWLLAGAFLVLTKSRYVENWPWHDFLRGQVVCQSVSELAVASRVPEQTVLLYLLHHEYKNPILFRGPYHGVFRRQANKGTLGFNIDVPTRHATVLAAGFIVLEIFDTRENERRVHTMLQDTREDLSLIHI